MDLVHKKVKATTKANKTLEYASSCLLDESIAEIESNQLGGSSLGSVPTRYHMGVLDHACQANMSLVQLKEFKGALNLKGSPVIHVGQSTDLMHTVGMVLKSNQEKELQWIISQYYQVFSIFSDGSLLGTNTEALMVQTVRKDNNNIINLLISVCLFESSLTGQNMASRVLSKLDRFDIDTSNWRPEMIDRYDTNILSLIEVRHHTKYNPSDQPCIYQTFPFHGKLFN